jgi:hypothetical protein
VSTQPRVQSLLLSWPHFILRVVRPFVPRSTLYFEVAAPHRLLKQEGTSSLGGLEVTLQLVNYYKAGERAVSVNGKAEASSNRQPARTQLAMRSGG